MYCFKGNAPLGILINDFLCSDPDDMLTPLLAEKARYLKTDPKGVELMCKQMDEMRKDVEQRTTLNAIRNIMEGLKYTAQQAMDLLKIPVPNQPSIFIKTLIL